MGLEYRAIISEHPKIETYTPDLFRQKYKDGNLEEFDGVVTHSSLEHSGLGRYGDALNPWGDILAVARAWCVTKPGGFMWLGVPIGRDLVLYNWHRMYGKYRWSLLMTNWKMKVSGGTRPEMSMEEKLQLGLWKGMKNDGFIFEKLEA